jgi:hypothetical protein
MDGVAYSAICDATFMSRRVIHVLLRSKSMFIRVCLQFLNFKMKSLETIRFSQIKKAHPINAGKPPAHDRKLAPQGREILSNRYLFHDNGCP